VTECIPFGESPPPHQVRTAGTCHSSKLPVDLIPPEPQRAPSRR
jgi:hypothetical protein